MEKDLNYWKKNAEEDYMKVPISVLRYITELENVALPQSDAINSPIIALSEIENLMEHWHHGRANDSETLQGINDALVKIGRLEWFNQDKKK